MTYTDNGDSGKNETCHYSADDLSRIASVDCGSSTWKQNITYDPFGNITKTVPGNSTGTSYTASYNQLTNQVSSNVSPAPAYDANGNQTVSGPATLTWNALAQPITVNSTTATYDALGRMVETGSGSTYQEFVYLPSGRLLGILNPSSGFSKETIPLPGGATAVYNASGLNFIRHKDWLGSSSLATTWAHAVYSKEAYAPFGETYNEAGAPDRSFTGQDQNTVTGPGGSGVYDFLFRKYDPSAGRWLSPDPAGWNAVDLTNPQSFSRYAYVQSNPLLLTDPDGNCAVTTIWNWYIGGVKGAEYGRTTSDDGYPCVSITSNMGQSEASGQNGGNGGGVAPNNGRYCTTSPANVSQRIAAAGQVAAMTAEFFSGGGPQNLTFGPDSSTSLVMGQSGPVQQVLDSYYSTGQTSGLYSFGLSGLASAGVNPVAQFVGSFRWTITPTSGGVFLTLKNTTSFRSLTYDRGPQWQRSGTTPMGNTHQTYIISAGCL